MRTRSTPGRLRDAALAAVLAAAIAGCATQGSSGPAMLPGEAQPSFGGRPATPLAGSSWYWLGTLTPAGLVAPSDPGTFNLEFLDGGQLAATLDCNAGGASWQQSGRSLTIGPVRSTRKACAAPSEADRFGRQLAMVTSARVAMGLLELSLRDAGSMVFSRDPQWRLRSFDCPGGVPPLRVVYGRAEAVVRWQDEAWAMAQQPAASGQRHAAEGAVLFSRGNEATLVRQGRQVAGPCVARR